MWFSISARPWAEVDEPHNTRKAVDAGLAEWARQSPAFRKLHQEINAQYPKALLALADYYAGRFGKNPAEAQAMAESNLDKAYRAYFVFSKNEDVQ